MSKNEVKEIKFQNKYVNGQALEVITDFSNNSYIIKGSTGIGGTTALLNYTQGNCLIVSPNVGMIEGKAQQTKNYNSDFRAFIYSGSENIDINNSWDFVNNYLTHTDESEQNIIINCTPDQLIKLRATNKGLYNQLLTIPIFIDEYHSYTIDSEFRNVMGEFLELVYNEWRANFKLSTATPNYNNIDVPTDKDVKYFKLTKSDQQPKPLKLSNNLADVKRFVYDENTKGRLVVLFSNDSDLHKSFKDLKVKNLVGKNLGIKLKAYKRGVEVSSDLYNDCELLILSSSYFAGFDIDVNCSICIVSNQKSDAFKIGVNDAVQCYGRARKQVFNALFVNAKSKIDVNTKLATQYPTSINEITNSIQFFNNQLEFFNSQIEGVTLYHDIKHIKEVTPHLYVNRAVLIEPILKNVLNYQLYNKEVLTAEFERYGFVLSQYDNNDFEIPKQNNSTPFKERLTNLLSYDSDMLLKNYKHSKYNLKSKNNGSFSHKATFELLTAYLLKITNSEIINKLNNKRVRPNEFFNSVDLFLRVNFDSKYVFEGLSVQQISNARRLYYSDGLSDYFRENYLLNDWQYLYSCFKVDNNILSESIEREIKLYEVFYDVSLYEPLVIDKSHRGRNIKKIIHSELNNFNIVLNEDEKDWLKDVSNKIFKKLDSGEKYINYNTRSAIKSKMNNVLIYLLTDGKIGSVSEVKNREYNPLTQTPKALRSIIPIKLVSVDLTSANPQIVDSILKTTIGLNVYNNLMTARNISRNKAKKIYNTCLNNHNLTVSNAKKIYLDCGYSDCKALELARLTANVEKGSFFEIMTANEKILMQRYKDILPFNSYRFHDAIIMSLEDIETNNIILPNVVKDYVYHSELFNDSSKYLGLTTNTPFNIIGFVNNYTKLAS
ncbi:hypothetical protein [Winogradskyella vidalii]|uniref:hypothetical protein n=1 Tax=Winogradskyella vidalii TaxID=2615024 RepID=UPI0015C79BF7|nr:hypothetical protein [Winogradskyella vidalii]